MISAANRAVALFAEYPNRSTALFATANRAAVLFAMPADPGNLQFVSGDLGKSMPGSSKANFGSYGPPI